MRRRRRNILGITGGIAAVAVVGVGVLMFLNRPLSRSELDQAVAEQLRAAVAEDDSLSSALLTVYAARDDRVLQYAVGTVRPGSDEAARTDSPYHSASVGKTMLATVFGQLVDEGAVEFDEPIATWLDTQTLDGLFVVDGTDHASEVTIAQLLSHTSGIADYFEGPVTSGATLLEQIAADPDRQFTPETLLAFSRDHQEPVGAPGTMFSYSDTGYILLGLVLEQIEGRPYADILDQRLFQPLGMADSHLMTRFGADSDILALTLDGIDLSERAALSVDWAGGGVVTTMDDLLRFSRALHEGELVSADVLDVFTDFSREMENGIRYGMGMMQFRFSELSPLLFSMTDLHGAVGASGTFALYDPSSDTHYVANFGSLGYRQKAIEQLVQIRLLVDRLQD